MRYKPHTDKQISRIPHKCAICRNGTIAVQYANHSGCVVNLCLKCDLTPDQPKPTTQKLM